MPPFQGLDLRNLETQGVALGFLIAPLWGYCIGQAVRDSPASSLMRVVHSFPTFPALGKVRAFFPANPVLKVEGLPDENRRDL